MLNSGAVSEKCIPCLNMARARSNTATLGTFGCDPIAVVVSRGCDNACEYAGRGATRHYGCDAADAVLHVVEVSVDVGVGVVVVGFVANDDVRQRVRFSILC